MLYFSIQNRLQDRTSKVSEAAGARWRFYPRTMVGLSSDYPRIVFILAEAIQRVSAAILNLKISWQAQYLLRLEVDIACSAHWKWRFIWDAHQSWDSFCVAGAVFGEVGMWLFVAGTAFRGILGDSRSAKCCIFQYKIVSKIGRVRSPKRRVRDDDFILGSWSDYPRIILESSLYWRKQFREFPLQSWTWRFRGRRSICWGWRLTLLALRIGNDVSYETRINHEIHFAWQAQYLVNLSCDGCCSAHCKWRFICDADQSWDSFCVAGAVFGEVGLSLFVAGAAFGDILGDSRSAKCCIFPYKIVFEVGRVRSPKRRVRDDDFMLGLSSDYRRIVVESSFYWRKQFTEFALKSWTCRFRGRRSIWWGWWLPVHAPRIVNDVSYVTRINHEIHFAWQAQYLVNLSCDGCCSAHCKWRFICDADQSWDSFCVAAGAVFGEDGLWFLLLRSL